MGVTATDLAQIPMSADLGSTLTRGSEFAEATGAGEVTLEHLLHALCDDPDAIAVLDASQINIEGLRADVTARAYQGQVNFHDQELAREPESLHYRAAQSCSQPSSAMRAAWRPKFCRRTD